MILTRLHVAGYSCQSVHAAVDDDDDDVLSVTLCCLILT